jgi:hypothetical protein
MLMPVRSREAKLEVQNFRTDDNLKKIGFKVIVSQIVDELLVDVGDVPANNANCVDFLRMKKKKSFK